MTEEQVVDMVYTLDPVARLIVFTGGEPMLQYDKFSPFAFRPFSKIAIETNGKLPPRGGIFGMGMHCTVSPKLTTATMSGYTKESLKLWSEQESVEFKFVVTEEGDLGEIDDILHYISPGIPIILQPNGQTDDYPLALRELYEWVGNWNDNKYRVRILPQLHRIMWGKDARGV